MTQRNPHIARNLKATREIIFRRPLYQKQSALSKIKVQAAFHNN